MQLNDFIKESLVRIAQGIRDANSELAETGAKINPRNVHVNTDSRRSYGQLVETTEKFNPVVELVEFDIAVYAEEGTETKGGIGISVGSIGIGAQGKSDQSKSSESRLRFKVPVAWPTAD